jgi:hypothetical protein
VPQSAEPSPASSPRRPTLLWRRCYALLSVSLAVFLASVVATATAFHGFQFGQTPHQIATNHAKQSSAKDLEKADAQYEHARSATTSALADYNAAKARLDIYVNEQLARPAQSGPTTDEPIPGAIEPSIAQLTPVNDAQAGEQSRELQSRVTEAQHACRVALDRQNEAWRRKLQLSANQAIADQVATLREQKSSIGDGPLRTTILWCGLLAITIGVFVAANAGVSEKVFETASDVRQQLGLTVLGLLRPALTPATRDQPRRQPNWVKHSIRSAELCLLALGVAVTALCLVDHQFFSKFLADPVAVIGAKLWC